MPASGFPGITWQCQTPRIQILSPHFSIRAYIALSLRWISLQCAFLFFSDNLLLFSRVSPFCSPVTYISSFYLSSKPALVFKPGSPSNYTELLPYRSHSHPPRHYVWSVCFVTRSVMDGHVCPRCYVFQGQMLEATSTGNCTEPLICNCSMVMFTDIRLVNPLTHYSCR